MMRGILKLCGLLHVRHSDSIVLIVSVLIKALL